MIHRAWSPVPPRLPHFATPGSVRHLATVVAVAYPPRRPPNTWSPGVPAPPGPCYWLVASGTSTAWRRGCLAAGLVRGTVCYCCLGGSSALVLCARRWRQIWGVGAGAGSRVSPLPPALLQRSWRCVWRVILSGCAFPSPAGTPFHAVSAFRELGPVDLRVRAACPLSACALVLARLVRPPPPEVGVARAPRAVLLQGAGRAVPGGWCPSAFSAPVPCSA